MSFPLTQLPFSANSTQMSKDDIRTLVDTFPGILTIAYTPKPPPNLKKCPKDHDTFGLAIFDSEQHCSEAKVKLLESTASSFYIAPEKVDSPQSPKPASPKKETPSTFGVGEGGFFDDSKISKAVERSSKLEDIKKTSESDAKHVSIPPEWQAEQQRIAGLAVLEDRLAGFRMPFNDADGNAPDPSLPKLERIGGVDISFVKDTNVAVASLVVIDFDSRKVIYESMHHCTMNLPYIAGYLAFREIGPLMHLVEKIRKEEPAKVPQIIYVDGCGILHPRRCGLATHLGVIADIPTVGCAKNMLAVDGMNRETVHAAMFGEEEEATAKSAVAVPKPKGKPVANPMKNVLHPLIGRSGTLFGHAVCTGNAGKNPIYISAGHRISLRSASMLGVMLATSRIVEPIRQADLRSRQYVKEHFEKDGHTK